MENFVDTQRLVDVHRSIVHKRHGIITSLIEEPESPDARGLFVFNALTVEASYFRENQYGFVQDPRNGSGAAFDRSTALWATFGEAIERYSAFIYRRDQFVFNNQVSLGTEAVPLSDFILFSNDQYLIDDFPFAFPDPNAMRHWIRGWNLSNEGKTCLVPAQIVYLGMQLDNRAENISQSVSTGLACGHSVESASLSGLYEVIERDAFSAMWQLKYSPPQLVIDARTMQRLDPGVRRALENPSIKIHLWCITTDVQIPVIIAMAESLFEGYLAVGACANFLPERAISKAVIESLHGLVWSRHMLNRGKAVPDLEEIKVPADHISYYLEPSHRSNLNFLFQSEDSITSSKLSSPSNLSRLDELVSRIAKLGYSPIIVDVTTPDIESLGLHVVRAIIPGLHPLLFGHKVISLDQRRLRRLANHWGMTEMPAPNVDPHPFP